MVARARGKGGKGQRPHRTLGDLAIVLEVIVGQASGPRQAGIGGLDGDRDRGPDGVARQAPGDPLMRATKALKNARG